MPPASPQALSPSDWAAIRAAYETTTEPVAAIASRFAIANIKIHGAAYRQGWLRFVAMPIAQPTAPTEAPPTPHANLTHVSLPRSKTSKPKRQGMIDRLYRVIDNNLSQLEDIMKNQSDPSIADNEKETRTIGTVIGNIEKLKGLEDDAGKSRITNKSVGAIADNAETERVGRALAERILRLATNQGT